MRRLYGPFVGGAAAWGLLALRVVSGLAIMQHGWPKIQNPFGWMGSGMPGFLQALAALSEFGGGLAWVLGLLTPIASFGILCTMATAITTVHLAKGDPWVASKPGTGSFEPALGYLAVAVLLMLAGPGKYSLDTLLFGRGEARSSGEE